MEDSCTVAHNLQPIAEATGTRIAGLSPRHVRATRRVVPERAMPVVTLPPAVVLKTLSKKN